VEHLFIYREAYKNEVTAKVWGTLLGNISGPQPTLPQKPTPPDPVRYLVMPHDTYARRPETGNTIATIIKRASGIKQMRADTAKGSRLNRIALMHSLLSPSPDGTPYLQIHASCTNLIRTLPELVYDETITEDIDSDAEDHAFDSSTYGLGTMKPKIIVPGGNLVQMGAQRTPLPDRGIRETRPGEYISDDLFRMFTQKPQPNRGTPE